MSIRPRKRPVCTSGYTAKVKTGCGNMYVTINRDEVGLVEVFGKLGKAGGCASAQLESICRLISVALRCDVSLDELVDHLKGIRCASPIWDEGKEIMSCADAIASVLQKELEKEVVVDDTKII